MHDPALDEGFPARRAARVTVTTTDGRTLSREVPYPKGDPRNPLSDEEIAAKFTRMSAHVLSAPQQARAVEIALTLRQRTLAELWDACAPAARGAY